uniref:Uncharacterized protein n=1 Tax=Cacopsylla melanoneura TaxID=428564 RepID=A0A8D9DV60_9HEMI
MITVKESFLLRSSNIGVVVTIVKETRTSFRFLSSRLEEVVKNVGKLFCLWSSEIAEMVTALEKINSLNISSFLTSLLSEGVVLTAKKSLSSNTTSVDSIVL